MFTHSEGQPEGFNVFYWCDDGAFKGRVSLVSITCPSISIVIIMISSLISSNSIEDLATALASELNCHKPANPLTPQRGLISTNAMSE